MSTNEPEAPSAIRKLQSASLNLVVAVVAALVFCVALEGAARIAFYARWGGELRPLAGNEYSLRLAFRLAPNRNGVNSQGFRRASEVSVQKPDGVYRIFVSGASTAFGLNSQYTEFENEPLTSDDTIDARLQAILEERHPEHEFEVINAGVSGYLLSQEVTQYVGKLTTFEPDLMVFVTAHNDISFISREWNAGRIAPYWMGQEIDRGERVLNSESLTGPLYYADIWLGRVSYAYYGLARAAASVVNRTGIGAHDNWGTAGFDPDDLESLVEDNGDLIEGWEPFTEMYVRLVRDLRAIAAERDHPTVFVIQPELLLEERTDLTELERRIQDRAFSHHRDLGSLAFHWLSPRVVDAVGALDQEGFTVLDLSTIGRYSEDQLYTDYTHLTREGNAVIAEQVYGEVVSRLGLD